MEVIKRYSKKWLKITFNKQWFTNALLYWGFVFGIILGILITMVLLDINAITAAIILLFLIYLFSRQ